MINIQIFESVKNLKSVKIKNVILHFSFDNLVAVFDGNFWVINTDFIDYSKSTNRHFRLIFLKPIKEALKNGDAFGLKGENFNKFVAGLIHA